LPASRALVNRMGFNNHGPAAVAERLAAASHVATWRLDPDRHLPGQVQGHPVAEAAGDYLISLRLLTIRRLPGDQRLEPEHARSGTLQDGRPARAARRWLRRPGGRRRRSAGTDHGQGFTGLDENALEELLGVCTEGGAEG
jgi:dihydroorotate dehydrogenase